MSERVLQAVMGRVPQWTPGVLPGYRRRALGNGRCYPGVCAAAGASVRGRVLQAVSAAELARLDRFEGDEYAAVVVPGVRLGAGGEGGPVSARVWVMREPEGMLEAEWSFDRFVEKDEAWYVDMCREWAADDLVEQQQCTPQRRGRN